MGRIDDVLNVAGHAWDHGNRSALVAHRLVAESAVGPKQAPRNRVSGLPYVVLNVRGGRSGGDADRKLRNWVRRTIESDRQAR